MSPFLSICVPAYRNVSSLHRLLRSIAQQRYQDFEVIVSDDSCSDELEDVIRAYQYLPGFRYVRNPRRLGSPANWEFCVSLSRGDWIKIMHHDDWFSGPDSLLHFASAAASTSVPMIFCSCDAYKGGAEFGFTYSPFGDRERLLGSAELRPYELLSMNRIGCPSVTLIRRAHFPGFDPHLIWFVDVDAYIRLIGAGDLLYLPARLVNVTYMSSDQITHTVGKDLAIGLRERVYLLDKYRLLVRREQAWPLVREWSSMPLPLLVRAILQPRLPSSWRTRWWLLTSLLGDRLRHALARLAGALSRPWKQFLLRLRRFRS